MGSGLVVATAGALIIRSFPNAWGISAGSLLIVLDTENSIKQNMLEESFTNLYPFIDNHKAIQSLAKAVKEKVPEKMSEGIKYYATLTESETLAILESVDMTPEQVKIVVDNLK